MIAGIGDLREAVDGHVVGGMNPQHVDEAEVTVDVAFRVEEVAGVEGLGDVPPEAVALLEQPLDQPLRFFDTVVLYVEDWARA
jgi:hypothetical protein